MSHQIFGACLLHAMYCWVLEQTNNVSPAFTDLPANDLDTEQETTHKGKHTVTTCSKGSSRAEQRSPCLDHEGQKTHLRCTCKIQGHHARDTLPWPSLLIFLSISLQTNTCSGTHCLTQLSFSPKPMSSRLCEPAVQADDPQS